MSPNQVSEVLSKHVLVVGDGTPGQGQTPFCRVACHQVFHIDQVETFFDRLRRITCRALLEADPLEIEGAPVQPDLVQLELGTDQHDCCPDFPLYLLGN